MTKRPSASVLALYDDIADVVNGHSASDALSVLATALIRTIVQTRQGADAPEVQQWIQDTAQKMIAVADCPVSQVVEIADSLSDAIAKH